MLLAGEKRSAGIKTCTLVNFTTKYLIWTGNGSKQNLEVRSSHDTQSLKICVVAEGGVCFHYIDESANAVEGQT